MIHGTVGPFGAYPLGSEPYNGAYLAHPAMGTGACLEPIQGAWSPFRKDTGPCSGLKVI